VSYTVGGTASAGSDYSTLSGSVTVTAGNTTAVIPVAVQDDSIVEGTETVSVTLTAATSNAAIRPQARTRSTSPMRTRRPSASPSRAAATALSRGSDDGEFTVTMTKASSTDTTVSYTVGGTASAGSDYTALSGSVIVLAGNTTAVIAVDVQDDRRSRVPRRSA